MKNEDIKKNIYDLEFNHALTNEAIFLGAIFTAVLTIILSESLPSSIPRMETIILLVASVIITIAYYNNKLDAIKLKIRKLKA